jgi:hypothetical protein
MKHQRGGTYISNQVRMDACHLISKHCTHILYSLQENPQRSPARLKKKRIIELIITENHGCDPGTGRR